MDMSVNLKFAELKSYGKLPSPRGMALKIIQLADNENTTTREIAQLIGSDPAMAGRIVKIANLLIPREGRPVSSVMDAVTVQGIKSVRQLALSLSLINDFHAGACRGFDYQKFWIHAVCTGLAAQQVVANLKIGVAEEAFLIGLLSQIGRLALATVFAEPYSQMLNHPGGAELVKMEREAFGFDHRQVTAWMLSDWGVAKNFQDIGLYLEQPQNSGFVEGERNWRLLHGFHFADQLASIFTVADRGSKIHGLMLLATRVGIKPSELIQIGDTVVKGLGEWGRLLNIDVPAIPAFETLLNGAASAPDLTEVVALSESNASQYKLRILLVDDDRAIRLLYKAILEKSGHTVTTANNGQEALDCVKACPPQLIISDWMMPQMDGIEFCRELRKNPHWCKIYVFIVTAQESTERLIEAFEAGANDYLSKPINARVLAARLRSAQSIIHMQETQEEDRRQLRQFADELAQSNKRLQELTLTDVLTGLPNRRYGMERLEQECALAARTMRPFCCMMIDVDHFKSVNDCYGHQAGDEALRLIALTLQQAARKQDVVARVGGEEFIVICPDSEAKAGFSYAERLRQQVAAQLLPLQEKSLSLTVSIGLTDNVGLANASEVLHQADKRLYAAKAAGRNCTIAI